MVMGFIDGGTIVISLNSNFENPFKLWVLVNVPNGNDVAPRWGATSLLVLNIIPRRNKSIVGSPAYSKTSIHKQASISQEML